MKKQLLNKKVIAGSLAAGIVLLSVGGGLYLSEKKKQQEQPTLQQIENESSNQSQNTEENLEKKEEAVNQTNTNNSNPSNQQSNNSGQTTAADNLDDILLQGSLNRSDNDSISVTLYGKPGNYTVEKQVNGAWQAVVTNKSYPGNGGLDLNEKILVSDEFQRVYRIFRISDSRSSAAKEITVDRNLVVSNRGVNTFPRAQ